MNRVKGVIVRSAIKAVISRGSVTVGDGGVEMAPVWGLLPFGLHAFSSWVEGQGGLGGTVSAVKGQLGTNKVVGVLS